MHFVDRQRCAGRPGGGPPTKHHRATPFAQPKAPAMRSPVAARPSAPSDRTCRASPGRRRRRCGSGGHRPPGRNSSHARCDAAASDGVGRPTVKSPTTATRWALGAPRSARPQCPAPASAPPAAAPHRHHRHGTAAAGLRPTVDRTHRHRAPAPRPVRNAGQAAVSPRHRPRPRTGRATGQGTGSSAAHRLQSPRRAAHAASTRSWRPPGWRCGPSQANASAGRAWTRSCSAGAIR